MVLSLTYFVGVVLKFAAYHILTTRSGRTAALAKALQSPGWRLPRRPRRSSRRGGLVCFASSSMFALLQVRVGLFPVWSVYVCIHRMAFGQVVLLRNVTGLPDQCRQWPQNEGMVCPHQSYQSIGGLQQTRIFSPG